MQSEKIDEIVKALTKAQQEMESASKDGKNPHFRSTYSTYTSVRAATFPALNKNGIAVFQTTNMDRDGYINIITTLAHESSQ